MAQSSPPDPFMSSQSSATLIVNGGSGITDCQGRACRVLDMLKGRGFAANLMAVRNGDDIKKAAREAVAAEVPLVIAAKGDGTINAVASEIIGTRAVLGVVPLGTLNHFAKDLRIPTDTDQAAVDVLTKGEVRFIDFGEVNGHIFLNNSSIGLYLHIVRGRTARQRLGHSKWVCVMVPRCDPSTNVDPASNQGAR